MRQTHDRQSHTPHHQQPQTDHLRVCHVRRRRLETTAQMVPAVRDEPLFPVPEGSPLPRSLTLREQEKAARPRWSRYRSVDPVKCDECLMVLHEHGGKGVATNPARWRRITQGMVLFLCHEHAEGWRETDRLT